MPIISQIGRRSFKARALIVGIYLLLSVGALTMVYPFLLMIAGSTKSAVDIKELTILPTYLYDDAALYRKHIEGLFNEDVDRMRMSYLTDVSSYERLTPPAELNQQRVDAWLAFLNDAQLSPLHYGIGYIRANVSRGVQPLLLRQLINRWDERYKGDLNAVNDALGTEFLNWASIYLLPEAFMQRRERPQHTPLSRELDSFQSEQPLAFRDYFTMEGFYRTLFLKTQYTRDIKEYNAKHGTAYASYDEIHLTRTLPDGTPAERKDWEDFVRTTLNLLWIRADPAAAAPYRAYLHAKYGSLEGLNRNYGSNYASFDEIPLIADAPSDGLRLSDWDGFLQGWKDPDTGDMHMLPVEHLRIHSVDFMFRDYLVKQHGDLAGINAALGTDYPNLLSITPPQYEAHYALFLPRRGELRWEFTVRNYITVANYMLLHGRGVFNTVVYCCLAILSALIVNPMAAYAMSRYKMPSTYKVLLFLMMTMAFPPMVTQIPNFLLLRELSLLNTFWALVLPGLANGYSIFLLKGFFDSLPRELYESASLDGANEWVMFWQITMNLSKPILAVIALSAFNHAYAAFMFALLICQDERMWTLMVWLYQLQMRSGSGVVFASLILAAIPTFLIFALCQNIIMRGIVVPVEK